MTDNFTFSKPKTFEPRCGNKITQTDIFIDGMLVGHITKRHEDGIVRVMFAVAKDHPCKYAWAAIQRPFTKESDAKKCIQKNIDEILRRFKLYPITMP